MTVFSEGDYDFKLLGMFKSFDVDNGGSIDRQEFLTFLYAAIFGLCKLLDLQQPNRDVVLEYSYGVFREIDEDGSGEIEFEEFSGWIKNNTDLQDFLLKYTGVQTFESAQRRFNGQIEVYKSIFDSISLDFMGENYCQMAELIKILNETLFFIDQDILNRLYLIMDYNNKGAISETEYLTIMKPWSSFSATDINNDNELDVVELKTLIWLTDGEEPDGKRVAKDLKLIDDDGSGTIDRIEWIQYLASPTGQGSSYFDFNLKNLFDKYDVDKDGSVNYDEFLNIIM